MHVLGRARGDNPQHLVPRAVGIIDNLPMAMVADEFPGGGIGEGRVAQLLHRTAVGVFNHADVVDQHLAIGKQPHVELAPLVVRPAATGGGLAVGVSFPRRPAGLVARCPRDCIAVVCIQIA